MKPKPPFINPAGQAILLPINPDPSQLNFNFSSQRKWHWRPYSRIACVYATFVIESRRRSAFLWGAETVLEF